MTDYTKLTLGELLAMPPVQRSAMSILKTLQRHEAIKRMAKELNK